MIISNLLLCFLKTNKCVDPIIQFQEFSTYNTTKCSTFAIFSELHVDHQELVNDQNLVFDPRSCAKLRKLKVLNTAKNQMLDLQPLDMIPSLSQLDVSGNFLKDLQRTIEIVARIPSLQVHTYKNSNGVTSYTNSFSFCS